MRSSIIILSALAAIASASPLVRFGTPNPLPNVHLVPKGEIKAPSPASCNLAAAQQPSDTSSPTQLPAPTAAIYHIAIGRGTQNYTCADSTAATVPVAIGAVATLYNASCVAASQPTLFSDIPSAALKVTLDEIPNSLIPSGHHYFTNPTTPIFDMGALGFTHAAKKASIPAPPATPSAVAWLQLDALPAEEIGPIAEIYRLNVAGGAAPATCSGMPAAFEVPYSAEYWFYAK